MKTAILYISKHGTTKKVAEMIQSRLPDAEVTLIDLKQEPRPDLSACDCVVLGCSLYASKPVKKFVRFCTEYATILQNIPTLGLFACGMERNPEQQEEELQAAFPPALAAYAKAIVFAGGEFLFEEMNLVERLIVKKVAKTSESVSALREEEIIRFVQTLTE